jgi:mannose-6-phosphate isomerase-like protein (cupin superfamily)
MATAELSKPVDVASSVSYGAPHCRASGGARGVCFQPDAFSLWRVTGDLDPDAEIEWGADHGDEAVYVAAGVLECDGATVAAGSTLVIEAGVRRAVRAIGPTSVLHFGPVSTVDRTGGLLGAAERPGRGTHIVSPEEAPSIYFPGGDGTTSIYFCDSTCPTCRITFFLYDGSALRDGYTGVSHLHSEDEIMHVLSGELHVGPLVVAPGMSIAVPGNLRYSFRTPGPFRYLTYRADVSTAVVTPDSAPVLETVSNLTSLGGGGVPDQASV